ncbi:MAG: phosphopentomutase [Alsobacter sp.]
MARAFLIVLDSVGCGGAEDAGAYGDVGANTLLHIAQACADGRADRQGLRAGPLRLPHLDALGLSLAAEASGGAALPGFASRRGAAGQWGFGVETAVGKDTPSGHWELAGARPDFAWGTFPDTSPCFPPGLIAALVREAGLPGILGDRHASGTAIVDALGAEHLRTGKPICYTSVDSVFQIAAHEDAFGLERLYEVCRVAFRLCEPLKIGRVIARPFLGTPESGFRRTAHRKDFAIAPPEGTILDRAAAAGRDIVTLGKIGDIFAHRHTGREVKAAGNMALFDALVQEASGLGQGGLIFANFVDFDSEFGHRRDVPGYAACLEAFDARVPDLMARLQPGDLAIFTADHGNDPTWPGTDHTREQVPILATGPQVRAGPIGRRATFADVAGTIATHLGLPVKPGETSWL